MKRIVIACLTLFTAMTLAACGTTPSSATPGQTKAVTILRHIDGSDAGFRDPGVQIINTADALETIGSGLLASVDVDFKRQSMIVLALGEQPTSGWAARISGVQQAGTTLFVQGTTHTPGDGDVVSQALTYPVAAVIVSKVQADVIHPEIEDAVADADGL